MITKFKIFENKDFSGIWHIGDRSDTHIDIGYLINNLVEIKLVKNEFKLVNNFSFSFQELFGEMVIGKKVKFNIIDRREGKFASREITGIPTEVDIFPYNPTEIYAKVNIDDKWFLVDDNNDFIIYDWQPGPLYKQYLLEIEAQKYNL